MLSNFRGMYAVGGAMLMLATTFVSAEQASPCGKDADDFSAQVKVVLGPIYAQPDDLKRIQAGMAQLTDLLSMAAHCSSQARAPGESGEERNRKIMGWHSMNQWLDRLVSRVGISARDGNDLSWRDEYELFAEVYEFKP
jgi:hypothetical protein